MRAGRYFRHHAAERRVLGELAEHPFGQNGAVRGQDGDRGFVA